MSLSTGEANVDSSVSSPDPENEYSGTLRWREIRDLPGVKGYRGILPTAAEDFATPTPEEEGWDLI